MKLRPYQRQIVAEVYQHIREGKKRILIFAPTGAGKTVIASQIVQDARSKDRSILFCVHRDILVKQTYSKLQSFGIDKCGFIKAGWKEDRTCPTQIASVQTLASRDWWNSELSNNIIILDEAHLTAWCAVTKRMMAEIFPENIYIGLSATPWRLNKNEGMGDRFEVVVSAPMPGELIEQGYLVKPSYYGITKADLEAVAIKNGDYDEKELSLIFDRPEQISQMVSEWQQRGCDRSTIVFAVNVEHSKNITAAFTTAGIAAAHIDGKTPIKVREKAYTQLASGEIKILSSCGALTEGFDVPAVAAILLARPTLSKALYFQMVGRGLRLSFETDKHDCLVLDFAGNVERHGFIEDLKEINLNSGCAREEDGSAPYKSCPTAKGGCGAIIYAWYKQCPKCNYNFTLEKLIVDLTLNRQLRPEDIVKFKIYRNNLKTAYYRKRSPGWAAIKFEKEFGYFPPDDWGKNAVFERAARTSEELSWIYQQHLEAIAYRLNKPQKWIDRYLRIEFGSQIVSAAR